MAPIAQTASTVASPQVVEIELLLEPIPGDKPAGESLQYSGLYDEIRETRRSEEMLEQGDWKRDTKVADWPEVVSLSSDALATKTKDLQVAAWLTEGLVKLYGYPGLRDGLTVMEGLHEKFWDGLYPEEDEGDLEARGNAISWMDRQVSQALKDLPLTGGSVSAYNYNQFEQSVVFNIGPGVDATAVEDRARRASAEGKITSEDWNKAKAATPRSFYETLFADINQCWANFGALDRTVDEKFGRQTPGMGALKKMLEQIRVVVEKIVKEKRILEPDPSDAIEDGETGEVGDAGSANGGGRAVSVSGPIKARSDAINRLKEVAAFFRQTEPHSPVSYLVERAVKWSQMPLDSWLASVIKDSNVLDSLRETLGVDGQAE